MKAVRPDFNPNEFYKGSGEYGIGCLYSLFNKLIEQNKSFHIGTQIQ